MRPSPQQPTATSGRTPLLGLLLALVSCGGGAEVAPPEDTSGGPPSPGHVEPEPAETAAAPAGQLPDEDAQDEDAQDEDAPAATPAPAPSPQDTASVQRPAMPAGPAPQRPERNFADRTVSPGPWYEPMKERLSGAKDGWPTETVAEVVTSGLAGMLRATLEGQPEQLTRELAKRFQCTTSLVAIKPEVLHEGAVSIRRGAPLKLEAAVDAEGFSGLLEALLAPLRGTTSQHVEVHVINIVADREADGRPAFETHATVRLSGERGPGSVQITTSWRARWVLGAKGARVRLAAVSAEDYQLTEVERRPFDELTLEVLGGTPYARSGELTRGSLEYFQRWDRLAGFSLVYLGMHGFAVGDLNGDDRQDLYVAQQAGVPNVLLLQGEDGIMVEAGPDAGVDLLDDTSGVTIVDLDGDGARDLLLGMGSRTVLLWNDGSGRFPDRSVLAAPSGEQVYTISAADADGDQDLDLYVTRYVKGGVIGGVPTPYHDARNGAKNLYFENLGERSFRDSTLEVGLDRANDRFSLAAIWEDLDGDGDLDLYVTNDFGRNNLYRNDLVVPAAGAEPGKFVDVAEQAGALDMAAGMGISCADADLDGDVDLYISNMFTAAGRRVTASHRWQPRAALELRSDYAMHTRGNTLLANLGGGNFQDVTRDSGAGPGGWAWGSVFLDFDNDALSDIFVPNGFLRGTRSERDLESFFWRAVVGASPLSWPPTEEYRNAWVGISNMSQIDGLSWNGGERDFAYWNVGDMRFIDTSAAAGLDFPDDARSAVATDIDRDGRVDLWIRNRTSPGLRFLRNVSARGENHALSVELRGPAPNTNAVGALVTLHAGELSYAQRVYAGSGYLTGSAGPLHFGLGPELSVDRLEVLWPDGTRQEAVDLPVDSHVVWSQGTEPSSTPLRSSSPLDERVPMRQAAGEGDEGTRETRVPLLDKLTYRAAPLPSFDGSTTHLRDHAGHPTLVVMWATYAPESVDALRPLVARAAELERAGIRVHPLTLDGVRDAERARATLQALGLESTGGRLDRRSRAAFETLALELLGGTPDLPLPLSFLFDGAGGVSALYISELPLDELLNDAARLSHDPELPEWRWETSLTGGRWLGRGPSRELAPMASHLSGQGFAELAQELSTLAEERAAQRRSGQR